MTTSATTTHQEYSGSIIIIVLPILVVLAIAITTVPVVTVVLIGLRRRYIKSTQIVQHLESNDMNVHVQQNISYNANSVAITASIRTSGSKCALTTKAYKFH